MHTEQKRKFMVNIAFVVTLLAFLYVTGKVLLVCFFPLIAGLFIAVMIRPIVRHCMRAYGFSEKLAGYAILSLVYIGIGFSVFLFGNLVIQIILQQAVKLPDFYRQTLRPSLDRLSAIIQGCLPAVLREGWSTDQLLESIQNGVLDLSAKIIAQLGLASTGLPDTLMTVFFTIVCSLLISAHYSEITGFIKKQIPAHRRPVVTSLQRGVWEAVGAYIRSYLLILAATFLQLLVGLRLLNVSDFWLVAMLIALLDLIPAIGMSMVFIPWSFLCFLQGENLMGAGLLLLFGVIASVHGILELKLLGTQMGGSPLVSICAIYLGYRLFGVGGMVVIPILVQLLVGLQNAGVIKIWKE